MTRFFLGFIVGAVAVALIQFRYALLPAYSVGGGEIVDKAPPDESTDPLHTAPAELRTDGSEAQRHTSAAAASSSANNRRESSNPDPGEPAGNSIANPIELPATHAGFVDKSTPSLPDEHSSLEQEAVDPTWAELVEGLIYSHISTHPQGQSIAIVSLVCRTSRCEIAGTVYGEQGGDVWQEVLGDMREQPWFATNFAPSMSGAGGGLPGEHRFITILARVGTEIAPPVEP